MAPMLFLKPMILGFKSNPLWIFFDVLNEKDNEDDKRRSQKTKQDNNVVVDDAAGDDDDGDGGGDDNDYYYCLCKDFLMYRLLRTAPRTAPRLSKDTLVRTAALEALKSSVALVMKIFPVPGTPCRCW